MSGLVFFARLLAAAVLTLICARFGVGLAAWNAANRLEQPTYRVLESLGSGVEIREYAPYVVAEATIRGPPSSSAGAGFKACAGYIFGGKNRRGQTFSMTSPVRTISSSESVRVSFVMAKNESVRTLPVPTNTDVKLRNVPSHTAAFVKFSGGRPTDRIIQRKQQILDAKLSASSLNYRRKPNSDVLVYGYHDPFITPKFLRRNEVGYFLNKK